MPFESWVTAHKRYSLCSVNFAHFFILTMTQLAFEGRDGHCRNILFIKQLFTNTLNVQFLMVNAASGIESCRISNFFEKSQEIAVRGYYDARKQFRVQEQGQKKEPPSCFDLEAYSCPSPSATIDTTKSIDLLSFAKCEV